MMTYKLFLAISISTLILASCSKNSDKQHDCSFEQIDENLDGLINNTEQSLLSECGQDKFTTKSEILNNLIGEWVLIGYGDGWSAKRSNPCIYMMITDEKIVVDFENASSSFESEHAWQILEIQTSFGQNFFSLNFEPELEVDIGISTFCEFYMYGNATFIDGDMYLFEKVN